MNIKQWNQTRMSTNENIHNAGQVVKASKCMSSSENNQIFINQTSYM